MSYKIIDPIGHKEESKGTFDTFFSSEKYNTLQDCYNANDYIVGNFVEDEEGVVYIELFSSKNPKTKKYHRLIHQNIRAGIDMIDDSLACKLAESL